ncbi:MAG: hypothetical protein ARM1_0845 [Candidatus Micrarchaeota archaeon]|nr:MAG: hypothetical protein ARM1_0845 [Candidatus Micrarchaeota archaeon]
MYMKLQIYSLDIMVALAVFAISLTFIMFYYNSIATDLSFNSYNNQAEIPYSVLSVYSNILSEGYPSNWYDYVNLSDPQQWPLITPGILGSNNTIMPEKLYTLIAMSNLNYSMTQVALGSQYNYYINIIGMENSSINISIGKKPKNANDVYVERRLTYIGSYPVEVYIELWD